uniref:Uncharacterized protein n=1 Tax=Clastoptera arizonana TaxID=38151 RepID=A0A1B6EC70_9HEMI
MAERISGAALTLAFNKRANSELGVLHEKLEVQLRDDLKKEIYSENTVTEKENDLVAYLSKLKKVCSHSIDPCTPESDVYLTPETSPTDIRHRYGHTRCASDSGLNNLANQPIDLRKTNALYYSLVTVDEVYDSYTNEADAILEKELAEQDELFKSFKSIISKEGQTSNINKGNKPSTFKLPFSPKHKIIFPRGQNKLLNKTACLDFKFDLNRTIKERYSQKKCVTNVCRIDGTATENVVEIVKHSTNVNNLRSFNSTEVENSASFYEKQCSLSNNKEKHIKQLENMSKLHKIEVDEVMSNTEIDIQGQDSCLEAGSSGYLTGSSPKETVSETSAADVTEVATSDDIPHDNDKSVQSSSVSSDEGTWESTFPNSNAADGIQVTSSINDEKCTNDIKPSPCNDIHNKEVKNFGDGFFSDNSQFEVHNLPSVRDPSIKTETSDILRNNNLTSNCYKGLVRSCKDVSILDNSKECENGHHTTVKTEITYEQESYIDYSNKEEELKPSNRHDVFDQADLDSNNCSHKTNCFIDASSLSDESEILVPTPRLSNIDNCYFDIYDTSVSNNITDKSKTTTNFVIQEKKISPLSINENLCNRQDNSNNSNSGFTEKTIPKESSSLPPSEKNDVSQPVNIESTQADFEKRRSSLIRRNTFELEPNDEKLAMLRHEFEKRQGNLISQSSKQSELSGEYDIGVSYEESSYKQGPPNSLSIQNNLPVHQVLDDEAHSPDSLNNDGIIDPFTERMDKKINCHGSIEDKRVISMDFLTRVVDSFKFALDWSRVL